MIRYLFYPIFAMVYSQWNIELRGNLIDRCCETSFPQRSSVSQREQRNESKTVTSWRSYLQESHDEVFSPRVYHLIFSCRSRKQIEQAQDIRLQLNQRCLITVLQVSTRPRPPLLQMDLQKVRRSLDS
jgi:hypothetical protein